MHQRSSERTGITREEAGRLAGLATNFYRAITECFFVLQSPWLGMLKIVPRPSKRMTFKDLNCFYEVRSDIPNEDTHQLVQVRKQFTLS
jgi:hypothetical protein